jgi:hypothetical protein
MTYQSLTAFLPLSARSIVVSHTVELPKKLLSSKMLCGVFLVEMAASFSHVGLDSGHRDAIVVIGCQLTLHGPFLMHPLILFVYMHNINEISYTTNRDHRRKDPAKFPAQGMSCIGNTNIPVTSLRVGRTFLRHRQQTRHFGGTDWRPLIPKVSSPYLFLILTKIAQSIILCYNYTHLLLPYIHQEQPQAPAKMTENMKNALKGVGGMSLPPSSYQP